MSGLDNRFSFFLNYSWNISGCVYVLWYLQRFSFISSIIMAQWVPSRVQRFIMAFSFCSKRFLYFGLNDIAGLEWIVFSFIWYFTASLSHLSFSRGSFSSTYKLWQTWTFLPKKKEWQKDCFSLDVTIILITFNPLIRFVVLKSDD